MYVSVMIFKEGLGLGLGLEFGHSLFIIHFGH